MNFFDAAFEAPAASPTPPPQAAQPQQQSLNEEVSEVMGQLGKFWGGFRKQSQTALEAAKKDLGGYVAQAQQELTKLTAAENTTGAAESSTTTRDGGSELSGDAGEASIAGPSSTSSSSSSMTASTSTLPAHDSPDSPDPSSSQSHQRSQSQNFFTRLQSSIPPDFLQKVQQNLPEQLRHAPERVDLAQLRTALSDELQRVKSSAAVTAATAESREFLRGATEFLKEAVKVVPPDEASASSGSGVQGIMWDGMDVWMIPMSSGAETPTSAAEGQDAGGSKARKSGEVKAIATRKEAILRTLRTNPDILKVDPRAEPRTKVLFEEWESKDVESLEGTVQGEAWIEKIQKELETDMNALTATRDTLTSQEGPALTENEFWMRYFFRKYQIEQDEERRKALLEGSIEQEEDIGWEDDDDEATSPTATGPSRNQSQQEEAKSEAPSTTAITAGDSAAPSTEQHLLAPATASTPGTGSPRESSEESYDMLSSSRTSNVGEPPVKVKERARRTEDDDDDSGSDWE
ncbi:uncharacterized protein STEHIDRAFT_125184 [Stereum hirsutum FP-91666 SS1]|uniref:uncharacterized protein n=1 Tax=Stereum hirsutum (strain FP-91666) TaxID=721885 RepID=UPI0004449A7F|nr:uncharacterized protein STEHIDRAFT_125184 [Stereum hirsutum FP-91666 SS1]EIM81669.1 hypothetical protein STEHIDRAFT_125184 [Stereum hirsutum FP-91666 SS1]